MGLYLLKRVENKKMTEQIRTSPESELIPISETPEFWKVTSTLIGAGAFVGAVASGILYFPTVVDTSIVNYASHIVKSAGIGALVGALPPIGIMLGEHPDNFI